MRSYQRLFAIVALVLAATLPGIRPASAAQPTCPCWEDGLLQALGNVSLQELAEFGICSTQPEHVGFDGDYGPAGVMGASMCSTEFNSRTEFQHCNLFFPPIPEIEPYATAVIAPTVSGPQDNLFPTCLVSPAGEAGLSGFEDNFSVPRAWACINDIAALCRSLPSLE